MELSPEQKMLTILGTTEEAIIMSTAAKTHRKQYMGSWRVESMQITVMIRLFPNNDIMYMALREIASQRYEDCKPGMPTSKKVAGGSIVVLYVSPSITGENDFFLMYKVMKENYVIKLGVFPAVVLINSGGMLMLLVFSSLKKII
jgi:hypothetical protein